MVRILKNLRSKLVDDGSIKEGSAPSYFLEGLLYNVPSEYFGKSYAQTFKAAMEWILAAKREDLVCANQQYYLVRDAYATCWPCSDCAKFLDAAVKLWNNW